MPKLLLWFLLLAFSLVIASHLLPTVVASSAHVSRILLSPSPAPSSSSLPGCPSMCGDVEIPYPFGIGAKCAWPGFEFTIDCNHTSNNHSPIPYTGNIQIKNISVDTGEMRVFTPVAYRCFNSSTTIESRASVSWDLVEPLVISAKKNVFTAIGCSTLAFLEGGRDSYWNYFTGCISSCVSLNASANNGDNCTGLGCCQSSIAAQLRSIVVDWASDNGSTNPSWDYSPCSYGFVAEMGSYNFSRLDLSGTGNESFISRVGETTISLVLDWAITKNGSCYRGPSGQMTAPACVNEHSECITAAQGDGYLCKCSKGYQGNPYLHDGCQDIDECDLPNQYPCGSGSRCENTRGTYKCKCKLFHIADGRNGCQNILRPVAIPAIFVVVVLACLVIITLLQSRNRKKLFNKNGGKILEAHGMTIYTQRQLKKITKSYSKSLGKGQFGIVYEGTIDGATAQRVAVKRSVVTSMGYMARRWQKMIRHEVPQNKPEDDGFVNEITFQFKISHPNVVQLLGCCLETDIPILVFEFVSNGSLHDVLHVHYKPYTLSLLTRLDIAIGSAKALSHMHSHGDNNRVHGDVKPANILLDKDLKPKVSDFGSSKLLSGHGYTWDVAADMSYIDPVYYSTHRFTVKSDVYSFGVVLLELITRKTARYGDNCSLTIDFKKACKDEGNGWKMYDEDILSSDDAQSHIWMECLDRIGTLALQCLKAEDVEERPTMAEVVEELERVKVVACRGSYSETS